MGDSIAYWTHIIYEHINGELPFLECAMRDVKRVPKPGLTMFTWNFPSGEMLLPNYFS